MRVTQWVGRSLFVTAAAGLFVSTVPAGATSVAAAPAVGDLPGGSQYVALGDSYSAGYGIPPSTGTPIPACAQSQQDYPNQVADALNLILIDVTCSGAETANIDLTPQTQFPDGGTGKVALQDAYLSADTKVVTVSIGGNDLGFSSIAAQCFALSKTGPVAGPPTAPSPFQSPDCRSFLATSTQTQLTTVVAPALTRVFGHIRSKAPNAKLFVVEYPALAPTASNTPAAGCFRAALGATGVNPPYPTNSYPFTDSDVPFLQQLQADLTTAIDKAARVAGAFVVPAFDETDSNSPCAAPADQLVRGITLSKVTLSPPSVQTVPGALHPNLAGADFLADQVQGVIEAIFNIGATPAPTPSTTPPGTLQPTPTATPAAPQLAATGTTRTAPLTWTALGLLVTGAAITTFERRTRPRMTPRAAHHR